jgi:hypothetical protein
LTNRSASQTWRGVCGQSCARRKILVARLCLLMLASSSVRAYAMVPNGSGRSAGIGRAIPSLFSAPRLSIVVLPFVNIGGDQEQDYFVDGITESLTTDLSRISGSFAVNRPRIMTPFVVQC